MSSSRQRALYERVTNLEIAKQRALIDALSRAMGSLEARLAQLEENRDAPNDTEAPVNRGKQARIPSRPTLMRATGVGKDPS